MLKSLTPVRAFELVSLLNKALGVYSEPEVMILMGVSKENCAEGQALQSELNLLAAVSDKESLDRLCNNIAALAGRVKDFHIKVKDSLEKHAETLQSKMNRTGSLKENIWARHKLANELHKAGIISDDTSKKTSLKSAERLLTLCEAATTPYLMGHRLTGEEIQVVSKVQQTIIALVAAVSEYEPLGFYNKLTEQEMITAPIFEKLFHQIDFRNTDDSNEPLLELAIQMTVDLLKPAPTDIREKVLSQVSDSLPPGAVSEIRRRMSLDSF